MSDQSKQAVAASIAAPAARPANVDVKVSPKARRMAQELGVDLSQLVGTGPGGMISGEDVERAAGAQKRFTESRVRNLRFPPCRPLLALSRV